MDRRNRQCSRLASATALTALCAPILMSSPRSFVRGPFIEHPQGIESAQQDNYLDSAKEQLQEPLPTTKSTTSSSKVATVVMSAAAGVGAVAAKRSLAQRQASNSKVDWTGSATGWQDIENKDFFEVDWLNVHGYLTVASLIMFLFSALRMCQHQAPGQIEVWVTSAIYIPWIYLCWRDTEQLETHYQVTFYASCGWAVMSLASLYSVFYQDKFPDAAFGILAFGNAVFLTSCVYFYGYHWSRMWRHLQENRFRPFWIPGLVGLMALHSLTLLDFWKRVDDPGWWKTVCQIYSDEWWWVADVRLIELFVTAAALWCIVLHIKGVFTGMKNAAVVVVGTIFAPLGFMVWESCCIRASSWQHYLMWGPKYW